MALFGGDKMFKKIKKQPVEVVDITSPAMNSMFGRYFTRQSSLRLVGRKRSE